MTWWIWVLAAAVLMAAGYAVVALPRQRERKAQLRTAWAAAHAALERASISRDAAPGEHLEAEQLLARATALAAEAGGPRAAQTVREQARRADRLWQEAARG
ncbi:DUF6403 family protein [Amycolatopsis benzoatilytica]|uniref:DUF6403 family protein n=1 Tax=Amycolatopsis benzoatilytica TaxID=346045 RepID=UPI00036E5298|nr:DUF6403 family protein [Amycolatopsis benzoatilytica]